MYYQIIGSKLLVSKLLKQTLQIEKRTHTNTPHTITPSHPHIKQKQKSKLQQRQTRDNTHDDDNNNNSNNKQNKTFEAARKYAVVNLVVCL